MLLKSIKLKNFKCYENWTCEFKPGITSIYGENGAGKSSILEAISWVLFNFIPYASNSRIIRSGAKTAEVELSIKSGLDGRDYLIKRKTQGLNCVIFDIAKNCAVAEGMSICQKWIRFHLGLREEKDLEAICRSGIATPQGTLSSDFLRRPEERKKIFNSLLGLDEFEEVHKKLGDALSLLKEDLTGLSISLAKNDGLDEEIQKVTEEIQIQEKALDEKNKVVNAIEFKLIKLKDEFEKAKDNKQKHDELSKEKQRLDADIHDTKQLIEIAEKAQEKKLSLDLIAEQYEKAKDNIKNLRLQKQELDNYQIQLNQLESELKLEQANLERVEEELSKLISVKSEYESLRPLSEEYQKLQNQDRKLNSEKAQLEAEISFKDQQKHEILNLSEEQKLLQQKLLLIPQQREIARNAERLEAEILSLRAEYKEVSDLEKASEKLGEKFTPTNQNELQLPPDSALKRGGNRSNNERSITLPSLPEIKIELEDLIQKKTEAEKEKNIIEAQIDVNEKLIPRLTESGVCPILLEPCMNLKAMDSAINAKFSLEEGQIENRKKTNQLIEFIKQAERQIELLKEQADILTELEGIKQKIQNRSSNELIALGKTKKEELDKAKEASLFVQGIADLEKKSEQIELKTKQLEMSLSEIKKKELRLKDSIIEIQTIEQTIAECKVQAEKALILKSELDKENLFQNLQKQHTEKVNIYQQNINQIKPQIEKHQDVPNLLKSLEADLENLEPLYIEWVSLKAEVEKIPDLQKKMERLTQTIDICLQSLQEIEYAGLKDNDWLELKLTELENTQKNFNQESGLKHSAKILLQEKQNRQNELKAKQQEFDHQKKNQEKLLAKNQKITKMRFIFKELSLKLAKEYTRHIGQRATNLFREIMQDGSYELTWSEDYQITTFKNGLELPFEVLSGGQQMSAAISIRLGLLQELSNIRFAFFDEPTAHLDSERRNQLAMQIGSIKSFDQLFVITHDESFASQANHQIYIG